MEIYIWQIVLAIMVFASIGRLIYIMCNVDDRGNFNNRWFDPMTLLFAMFSLVVIGTIIFYQVIFWLLPLLTDFLSFKVYP